jgi:hypothetical protein
MARFERVRLDSIDWEKTLNTFPDRIVYQTPAWLSFLAETQKGEPVVAALKEGEETLGYFTGLIVKKFGLRILGSPFRGWSTPYMGFNLPPSVPRRLAAEALSDFAFKKLGCIYFEVVDSHLKPEDVAGLGFTEETRATMEIDLTQSEDALLKNMTKSCRWTVRKAERNGVVIETAHDEKFAEDFSEQLKDVFDKQGLVPHFGVERMRALIQHVHPTGTLLLLRARDPEGHCIGTGVFPAVNETAYYWGGASLRQHQKLYPNELLQWYAMKHLKQRGIKRYNMVGTMEFKQKFGGVQTAVPMIARSKNLMIARLRASAPRIIKTGMRLAWKLKNLARGDRKACFM